MLFTFHLKFNVWYCVLENRNLTFQGLHLQEQGSKLSGLSTFTYLITDLMALQNFQCMLCLLYCQAS